MIQNSTLIHGTATVIPLKELETSLTEKKKLIIKFGVDPTAPDLHLGHAVILCKLRQFQNAGHTIVFLIGDFTAQIGDPTGKSKTRPSLSSQQIEDNLKTYFEQVKKILDPEHTIIRKNSEFLAGITLHHILQLCSKVTLARLIERDDFAIRISEHRPIAMHELLYPLMQGYDSVALHADIEIGGTDQTFNMLMGRFLQEQYGQKPQIVITMPLLEGIDGVQKMSKSLGNSIGLCDRADQAFGKLMSIPDALVYRYLSLLLSYETDTILHIKNDVASGILHPMTLKKQMAHDIIQKFWSRLQADDAQQKFEAIYQHKNYSAATPIALAKDFANPCWIVDLLKAIQAVESSSQARRLIDAGAVSIDGIVVKEFKQMINWHSGTIVKAGKMHICTII